MDEQAEGWREVTGRPVTVAIGGKERTIVVPLDDDPDLPEAEIKARAVEAWRDLEAAERGLLAEEVTWMQELMASSGLFDDFAQQTSEAFSELVDVTLNDEPEPGDPPDLAAWEAAATQRLRKICTTVLHERAADDDFRSTFARDVLRQAVAWTLADLKASMPRDQLLAMDDEAFHRAFTKRYHEGRFLSSTLHTLFNAYFKQALDDLAKALDQDTDLGKKLTDATRRALLGPEDAGATTVHPKRPGRRRLALQPPTHPLVYPNEPGHRALMYGTTSNPKSWRMDGERAVLNTPLSDPGRKRSLDIILDYDADTGGATDPLAIVAEMVSAGEDGTALKTLLALPALFFDHNPEARYNAVYETTIPDLMRYMGYKAHKRGGFDREDQERVWRAIRWLSRLWIPAITAHTRKGQRLVTGEGTWYSPVIVIQGIQEGPHGLQLPQAIRYSLGREFHAYYSGEADKNTRMARLSPRIMELHSKNDLNPLRLAVYYAGQFRINKQGGKYGSATVRVRYGHLLEQSGVPIDTKNPKRQFERVTGWHGELAHKEIIGNFEYVDPPKAAGLADYRKLLLTVEPPTLIDTGRAR